MAKEGKKSGTANNNNSITVETALDAAINGDNAGSPTSIPLEEECTDTPENETASTPKTVDRTLGCVVYQLDNQRLTESDLALAWKEFNNPRFNGRKISFKVRAIDQRTNQYMGEIVQITVIPNDLTHGSVSGRTIGFSGFLTGEVQTPNREGGGLCPQDPEGWEGAPIWVSISYDVYDQVGRIEAYKKNRTEYPLAKVDVSTALDLTANQVG